MSQSQQDSAEYLQKKAFYRSLLTVYGRKPVLEALQNPAVKAFRLHLAQSNKASTIIDEIQALALAKYAEVVYHTRSELSRISKNAKQDQGVCVDLICPGFEDIESFVARQGDANFELIALDKVTNPQNLGMIIRSVTAGFSQGILLPETGCAQIDPLVIKASAGTVFKANIIRCPKLIPALQQLQTAGAKIISLAGDGEASFKVVDQAPQRVFVLGNETDGVSREVSQMSDHRVAITMNNGVESLNVAVTAALLAYRNHLR